VRICQMHGKQHNRLDFLPHWSILLRQARRLAVECAGDEIAPSSLRYFLRYSKDEF